MTTHELMTLRAAARELKDLGEKLRPLYAHGREIFAGFTSGLDRSVPQSRMEESLSYLVRREPNWDRLDAVLAEAEVLEAECSRMLGQEAPADAQAVAEAPAA
jgi:hypothetical protein